MPYDGVVEANKIRLWVRENPLIETSRDMSECDTDDDYSDQEEEFHGFMPEEVDRGRSISQFGRAVNCGNGTQHATTDGA